ncbi:MAG: START domain-containing protein [Ferruginibacter sp.]
MPRIFLILLMGLQATISFGQYNWKQEKDKNGIKVYSSDAENSVFKAIKVECNFTGNYTKLISILTDLPQFSNWIFHSKSNRLLQKNSPLDFIYHTETEMPWPLTNRDAVIHIRIGTDSLPKFLAISGSSEPGLLPKTSGKVRVEHYAATWKVTMPTAQTVQIYYQLEVDPGGSIPGWVANMFSARGPFETFSNLARKLSE